MQLSNNELLMINGGAISSTLLGGIIKGISLLIDLGKSLGSSIRRAASNKSCEI